MSERITIVGAGNVGANLARAFSAAGHGVRVAGRDPSGERIVALRDELDVEAVRIEDAAAGTDIVLLAVPSAAVASTVDAIAPPGDVVVVDATNPIGVTLPEGATSTLDVIALHGATGPLVKAFNTIGAEAFLDPVIDGRPLFLPIAGDEPGAGRVRDLAASIGFDAVVVGDRSTARLNENAAELWIHLAFRTGLGRSFGFARLER